MYGVVCLRLRVNCTVCLVLYMPSLPNVMKDVYFPSVRPGWISTWLRPNSHSYVSTSVSCPKPQFSCSPLLQSPLLPLCFILPLPFSCSHICFMSSLPFSLSTSFDVFRVQSDDICTRLKQKFQENSCLLESRGSTFTIQHFADEVSQTSLQSLPIARLITRALCWK